MASAIYILDERLNLLIQRCFRGNLHSELALVQFKRGKKATGPHNTPIINYKNNIFCQIHYDELILMAPLLTDCDTMGVVTFMRKFCDLLKEYFKHYKLLNLKHPKLTVDLIKDNYVLIYELFDECFDFGVPQLTDFSILKEYIKLLIKPEDYYDHSHFNSEVDQLELQVEQEINSSVSRTAMTKISWRPKGIFYNKNELFVDCNEYVTFKYNYKTNKVIINKINGELICKSYLSGMPLVKMGLNETLAKNKSIFSNVQYHQCVDLNKLDSNVVEFIPCDGSFKLLSYQILDTKVLQPLIYVKPIYKIFEKNGIYKLRIKVEMVTTFKRKYTMSDVSIRIPLIINHPILLINFNTVLKYKTKLGSVIHKLEDECLAWNIEKVQGTMSGEMLAEFDLMTERELWDIHKENSMRFKQERNDLYYFELNEELNKLHENNKFQRIIDGRKVKSEISSNLSVDFNMNGMTYSGVEISFLNVIENQLKFDSFNWKFHHVIARHSDYSFILSDDQFHSSLSEEIETHIQTSGRYTGYIEEEDIESSEKLPEENKQQIESNNSSTALDSTEGHIKELKKKKTLNKDDLDFEEYIVEGEERNCSNI